MAELLSTRIGALTYIAPPQALIESYAIDQLAMTFAKHIEARDVSLVLDLADVPLVNSRALELLLSTQEQLIRMGGSLQLASVNTLIQDILRITRLAEHLAVMSRNSKGVSSIFVPSDGVKRNKLGDILVELGFCDEEKIRSAMQLQNTTGKRMGIILVENQWIKPDDLLRALSVQLQIPMVNLRPGLYDSAIATTVPQDVAKRLSVIPLFKVHGKLALATANPQSMPSLDEIEKLTSCRVYPVLCTAENIARAIDEAYGGDSMLLDYIDDSEADLELVANTVPDNYAAIDQMAEGSPVINFVNSMIQRAVRDGASDIHIEPSRTKTRVRFRIDGVLYEAMSTRLEMHPAIVSRLKVMANLDIAERRLPQDGRIQVHTQGRAVDLRFSSLPGIYGEKIVLRVLDKNQAILDIDKLGMSQHNVTAFKNLLKRSYGLVLVTGPTGSGKTTSLYAALNHLNSIEKNIVTIEDPVEYQIDVINQNQIKDSIGLTFPKILKHVLRQDPDIVMVGEIRERETAEIAVQAALTGHLVLSTLHTNDSIGTITRMMDMGIEPYLLSSALIAVIAQRLVRRVCSECKTSYVAPLELAQQYHWPTDKSIRLVRGRGCPACYDSGYKGRLAIHEILLVDNVLQSLMMTNPSRDQLVKYVEDRKFPTLFQDGMDHVLQGHTTIEEVNRVINTV